MVGGKGAGENWGLFAVCCVVQICVHDGGVGFLAGVKWMTRMLCILMISQKNGQR